jgi:ABC-2 type transport system permease protein
MRAAAGAPWWEIAGTIALMVATAAFVVWVSARAFRAGALSSAKFDLQTFMQGVRSAGR